MTGLRLISSEYANLTRRMLDNVHETCAILFTRNAGPSLLVAETLVAPDQAYTHRDEVSAGLTSTFLMEIAHYARTNDFGIVLAHTHPATHGFPEFSRVDDAGEQPVAQYFGRRAPVGRHVALVIAPGGCRARFLGTRDELDVWSVGPELRRLSPSSDRHAISEREDRQVRAFGEEGQATLAKLAVAIVGLGGTGSVTALQLAHLGVNEFIFVDFDTAEESNLNRLVGADHGDIGQPKVLVAQRMIAAINPSANVTVICGDVVDFDVARQLEGCDLIFLCTDSHASRAVINQFAYQHLIPAIDMGVSITVANDAVSHITGRVQMLAPSLPCLVCTNALDGQQIRQELQTPEQRAADPYFQGAHVAQPAVISLNATAASLAVTMFLGCVTSVPASAKFQYYDGIKGTVRPTTAQQVPNCIICSSQGALRRGDSVSLPTRNCRIGRAP